MKMMMAHKETMETFNTYRHICSRFIIMLVTLGLGSLVAIANLGQGFDEFMPTAEPKALLALLTVSLRTRRAALTLPTSK